MRAPSSLEFHGVRRECPHGETVPAPYLPPFHICQQYRLWADRQVDQQAPRLRLRLQRRGWLAADARCRSVSKCRHVAMAYSPYRIGLDDSGLPTLHHCEPPLRAKPSQVEYLELHGKGKGSFEPTLCPISAERGEGKPYVRVSVFGVWTPAQKHTRSELRARVGGMVQGFGSVPPELTSIVPTHLGDLVPGPPRRHTPGNTPGAHATDLLAITAEMLPDTPHNERIVQPVRVLVLPTTPLSTATIFRPVHGPSDVTDRNTISVFVLLLCSNIEPTRP